MARVKGQKGREKVEQMEQKGQVEWVKMGGTWEEHGRKKKIRHGHQCGGKHAGGRV
jgi:hypothetical protein